MTLNEINNYTILDKKCMQLEAYMPILKMYNELSQ